MTQIEEASSAVRIGADVGGTFTDVVLIDEKGRLWIHKVPSTPPDFDRAVLGAIRHLLEEADVDGSLVREVAHGTTVATNAVLERRGARTALITTRGFRDVLELRRMKAPQLYDLGFQKPPALIERRLRLEVSERVSATGEVLVSLSRDELPDLADRLAYENVESAAVCFLHAYAFPEHERTAGEFLRQRLPHVPVSLSCDVLPERREYERTATTAINAYVQPLMQRYLGAMHAGLYELNNRCPPADHAVGRRADAGRGCGGAAGLRAGVRSRRRGAGGRIRGPAGGPGQRHHPGHGRHHSQNLDDRGRGHRLQRRV